MTLKDPPLDSDGPDRNRFHPGNCKDHQNGIRTGYLDACCCCNPCLYRKRDEEVVNNEFKHCCRCSPRIIVARFEPDPDLPENECCLTEIVPLLATSSVNSSGDNTVRYSGSIAGHTINVYQSKSRIDQSDYEYEDRICRWTIDLPGLGVTEEFEIDHVNVTCLGVPSFTVNNVTSFNDCVGQISLLNFQADKVPFQLREFASDDVEFAGIDNSEGLSIPMTESCGDCAETARVLCVSGIRHYGGGNEYVEFVWNKDFVPYDDSTIDGRVIGQFVYDPPVDSERTERLYLVEKENPYGDSYGDALCWIYTDFESPDGPDPEKEDFNPIQINEDTGCGCDIRETAQESRGVGASLEVIAITIKAGACSCWAYYCGSCRCVPHALCGYAFFEGTFYNNLRFVWDPDRFGWALSYEPTDPESALGDDWFIQLEWDGEGGCQVSLDIYGYDIDPQSFSCGLIKSATFAASNSAKDDYLFLSVNTAFADDCEDLIICNDATPCADRCGSHPPVLTFTMTEWNDPYEDEPGIDGECSIEMEIFYWEQVHNLGNGEIEILCGYIGFKKVECPDDETRIVRVDLTRGEVEINNFRPSGEPVGDLFILDYERCEPYVGEYVSGHIGIIDCLSGCSESIQRREIEIME